MDSDPIKIDQIFDRAREIQDHEERCAYLDQVCGDDPALRQRLDALLRASDQASGFIKGLEKDLASVTDDEWDAECVNSQLDRYRLLEKIGEGGFGIVYLAEQRVPVRRRIALKIIKAGMDTKEVIGRFEAERQALALMDHPHIAKVFDGGATENGRPYFVMELVRGLPITQHCQEAQLSIRQILELFIQICEAIQHAHQKGIIHRDIKPSNVMVTRHDGEAVPKVIDFGIAKALHQELSDTTVFTRFAHILGTPAYMSPEQAALGGSDIDTRSDIYSLGALLYELITGTAPFDSSELLTSGLDAMRQIIREREPIKPSIRLHSQTTAQSFRNRRGDLLAFEADLDWILIKCLEKDRDRRYESASELAGDLRRYLNGEPVTAAAPSFTYQFGKFYRKYRTGITVASFGVLMLALTAAISLWLAYRAVNAEGAAEAAKNQAEEERRLALEAKENAELYHYYGSIALAERSLENGNIDRAKQELLASPVEHRNWEWGYLLAQCHQEILSFLTTATPHPKIGISPDNRLLYVFSRPTLRVWDLRSGQELYSVGSSLDPISGVEYNPRENWIFLGTIIADRLIDANTGQTLYTINRDTEQNQVSSLIFSRDGSRFVTANRSRDTVTIHETRTGKVLLRIRSDPKYVQSPYFSSDDRYIISQPRMRFDDPTSIYVWDSERSEEAFSVNLKDRTILKISPTVDYYAAVTQNGPVEIRRVQTDELVSLTDSGIGSQIFSWTKGGRLFIENETHSTDVWDPDIGLKSFRIAARANYYHQTSDAGSIIATMGPGNDPTIWDGRNGERIRVLNGHRDTVRSLEFSADGSLVATASEDGEVKVWSLSGGRNRIHAEDWLIDGAYSPNGKTLAATGWDHSVTLFDVESGQPKLKLEGHLSEVTGVAYSPNGEWLVSVGYDNAGRIWDAHSGALLGSLVGHEEKIGAVAVSPDGRMIATGSWDGSVIFWDSGTGAKTHRLKIDSRVFAIAFSPDQKFLATGSDDHHVKLWRPESGQLEKSFIGHSDSVYGVDFHPDGRLLASGSNDGTIQLWDIESGRVVQSIKTGSRVSGEIRFGHDGSRLYSVSSDLGEDSRQPAIHVWDPSTGHELLSLSGRSFKFAGIATDPTGGRLASLGKEALHQWERFPLEESSYPGNVGQPLEERIRQFADQYWRRRINTDERTDVTRRKIGAPYHVLFPGREVNTSAKLIDLTAHYNGGLNFNWLPHRQNSLGYQQDLVSLPQGVVTLRDVQFDVRGLIQLAANEEDYKKIFPERADGIRVDQKAKHLHVLHAHSRLEERRQLIGWYIVHYTDGTQAELEIRIGQDLRRWWRRTGESLPTSAATMAWTGFNREANLNNRTLHLFQRTYENPKPEIEISHLDFVSAMGDAAPFLVALTVTDHPLPVIESQPESIQVAVQQTASFTVNASCEQPLSYQWYQNQVPINNATNATLTLQHIEPEDAGIYHARVANSASRSLYRIRSEPARLTVADDQYTYGQVKAEYFLNIPGLSIQALTNHVRFPERPDEIRLLDRMELPVDEWDLRDNLGVRLSGLLTPPRSGDYQFYLSARQRGILFLSSNEAPNERQEIAFVSVPNGVRNWTSRWNSVDSEVISAPIRLEAGKSYYLEALMKVDFGKQSLGVAWKLPDGPEPKFGESPIPGRYIALPNRRPQATEPEGLDSDASRR